MMFQLVVDDGLLILDAFVGWPGSTHDARVLRNSPLYSNIEDGDLMAPDLFLIGMYVINLISVFSDTTVANACAGVTLNFDPVEK